MRSCQFPIVAAVLIAAGCDSNDPAATAGRPEISEEQASMDDGIGDDDWQELWDARLAALEALFGKSEGRIAKSPVPIYLGGGADVLTFRNHIDGVVYVSAGLIGDGSQKKTDFGEYELMICAREENEWMPSLMSKLAPYTFKAALNPGDTMDSSPAMPEGSTLAALLYIPYRQFKVSDIDAGVLLCIGITETELKHCRKHGHTDVLARLKAESIYPFTDPNRNSVVP